MPLTIGRKRPFGRMQKSTPMKNLPFRRLNLKLILFRNGGLFADNPNNFSSVGLAPGMNSYPIISPLTSSPSKENNRTLSISFQRLSGESAVTFR